MLQSKNVPLFVFCNKCHETKFKIESLSKAGQSFSHTSISVLNVLKETDDELPDMPNKNY